MLYRFGHIAFRLYFNIFYRLKIEGRENIPETGPFIVCSNHISWFDPPLVGCIIPARVQVHFMAKSELFAHPLARRFLHKLGAFPVRRDQADRTAIRTALQLLREGKVLGLFPEGSRSKIGDLRPAYNGAALIALRSGAPVLPVAISGPYRLGKPVRVHIGPPLKLAAEENKKRRDNLEQSSAKIMVQIGALLPERNSNEQF